MRKTLLDTKPLAMAMFAVQIPHYAEERNHYGTLKNVIHKMVFCDGLYDIFKKRYFCQGNATATRAQMVFKYLALDAQGACRYG